MDFRNTVVSTVRDVKNAYWDLVVAQSALAVQRTTLELSLQTLGDNRKRVEVGTMAPIDIVQAEAEVAVERGERDHRRADGRAGPGPAPRADSRPGDAGLLEHDVRAGRPAVAGDLAGRRRCRGRQGHVEPARPAAGPQAAREQRRPPQVLQEPDAARHLGRRRLRPGRSRRHGAQPRRQRHRPGRSRPARRTSPTPKSSGTSSASRSRPGRSASM